jgi:hypothetical protein
MRTASRYSHASPDIMGYHRLCGEYSLTDELGNANLRETSEDRRSRPSKALSSSVDESKNGHERSRSGRQRYRNKSRQRSSGMQRLLFALLCREVRKSGLIFVFEEYVMLARLRDNLGR